MSDKRAAKRGRPSSNTVKASITPSTNTQLSPTLPNPESIASGFNPATPFFGNSANAQQSFAPPQSFPSSTLPPVSPANSSPFRQPPPGKLRLPPLPRPQLPGASNKEKNRTAHACDKCRKAKAKCSGGSPCDKCKNEDKECVYGDGKRDKEKKEMDKLQLKYQKISKKNDYLLDALKSMGSSATVDPATRRQVELLLEQAPLSDDEDEIPSPASSQFSSPGQSPPMLSRDDRAGSTASLDVIREDTNRDSTTRAAGFLGKSSAVSWVQRAKREITGQRQLSRGSSAHPSDIPKGAFAASAFHAESSDFPGLDVEINAFEWPDPVLANILVEAYFTNIHITFPVVSKAEFMVEYENFPREPLQLNAKQQTWLSMLNLMFAIVSKYRRLSGAGQIGDQRDHLIFYARAKRLGLDARTLNDDPEVGHTSCLTLLGLYLLSTDQMNKAYIISGVAVRHAVALGLHVRNEAQDLPDTEKEHRVRLWWAIYELERLLAELTGRSSCISDRDTGTPLPINVDEATFRRDTPLYNQRHLSNTSTSTKDSPSKSHARTKSSSGRSSTTGPPTDSSNSISLTFMLQTLRLPLTTSTYFIYRTSLSIVSHEILTQLYCASLVNAKWSEVQNTIRRLDSRLQDWKDSLSAEYDFSVTRSPLSNPEHPALASQRSGLAMFYYSSRMTLFRPTLCRLEGRIPNETEKSRSFNRDSVTACVNSARATIHALPDTSSGNNTANFSPQTHQFYTMTTPFWQNLHCLIEAASVLMLELAYRAEHLQGEAKVLLQDSKKAVLWLRALSDESVAARKGWEIFDQLLRAAAPRVGGTVADMPTFAPQPTGWTGSRFGSGGATERHVATEEQSLQQQASRAVHSQQQQQQRQHQQQSPSFYAQSAIPAPARTQPFDTSSTWVQHTTQPTAHYPSSAESYSMSIQSPEASSGLPQTSNPIAMNYGYMSGLQPFSAAGQMYSRFDEFGPWFSAYNGQDVGGLVNHEGVVGSESMDMSVHGLQLGVGASTGDGGAGYMGGGHSGMDYDWSGEGGMGDGGVGGR